MKVKIMAAMVHESMDRHVGTHALPSIHFCIIIKSIKQMEKRL